MKASTTKHANVRALAGRAGLPKPIDLAAASGLSLPTIYRAMEGRALSGLALRALAMALSVTEEECRAAVGRGRPSKTRKAKP